MVVAPETGAAGIGMADPRPADGEDDPCDPDPDEPEDEGGQVSAGGRDRGWESASVRGR